MNLKAMKRIAAYALITITTFTGVANAATDSEECAAAKMKAASKYIACRLAADAKAKSTGDAADYTKCDAGQSKTWTKIETRYPTGCPTSGDQAAVQADLAAATSCVADELAGPMGSCDTSAELLCGNGVLDAGEVCDQSALGGATCSSATSGVQAFGTLRCSADCEGFDTSACITCPATGTVADGQCWVLGALGDSCTAACALHSMATSSATLDLSGINFTTCGWVMAKLGAHPGFNTFQGPPNVGCWITDLGGSPQISSTVTQQGSSPTARRACACE